MVPVWCGVVWCGVVWCLCGVVWCEAETAQHGVGTMLCAPHPPCLPHLPVCWPWALCVDVQTFDYDSAQVACTQNQRVRRRWVGRGASREDADEDDGACVGLCPAFLELPDAAGSW